MAEQQPTEEVKNCPQCKRPMKRAKRFYRNGKYYCNENCYRASKQKSAAQPEQAAQ